MKTLSSVGLKNFFNFIIISNPVNKLAVNRIKFVTLLISPNVCYDRGHLIFIRPKEFCLLKYIKQTFLEKSACKMPAKRVILTRFNDK